MGSIKPFPRHSRLDVQDCARRDSEIGGYRAMASRVAADRLHLLSVELRVPMAFTSIGYAMFNTILNILGSGSPSKISSKIIGWVAVTVQGFHTKRSWANKGFKDEDVNAYLAPFAKRNSKVSGFFAPRGKNLRFYFPFAAIFVFANMLARAYQSIEANFVNALIADNRPPLFNHSQSPITKAPWEEVRHQHGILMFGSYPSRTEVLYG